MQQQNPVIDLMSVRSIATTRKKLKKITQVVMTQYKNKKVRTRVFRSYNEVTTIRLEALAKKYRWVCNTRSIYIN